MPRIDDASDRLDALLAGLEDGVAGTEIATAAFSKEMEAARTAMQSASRDAAGLSRTLGTSLRSAFDNLIFDGARLSDVLSGIGRSVVGASLSQALRPVQNALGGALGGGLQTLVSGLLPFENGAAFSAGRVAAFAKGGVVGGPAAFPMRGGVGLMGEAGPEAIMPLARGADGRLGVHGLGGGGHVSVTMNVTTPDVENFRRSRTQIAAGLGRAIQRGGRNQ
ncbi:MAG: phage tail tape measure protein [Paracoccaceae bacterium]